MPQGCENYIELNEASRNSEYQPVDQTCTSTGQCYCKEECECDRPTEDKTTPITGGGSQWYRFVPPAGVKMEELFLGGDKCGTEYTGCLEGGHPDQVGEVVARTVVFGRILPKPDYNINIKVAKCNDGSTDYFVYRLPYVKEVNQCLRYCGSY